MAIPHRLPKLGEHASESLSQWLIKAVTEDFKVTFQRVRNCRHFVIQRPDIPGLTDSRSLGRERSRKSNKGN
jgi:hypothetical protein